MFSSNKISQHNLNSNIPHRPSIAQALHTFCMRSRQTISAMLSLATTLHQPTTYSLSTHIKTHYTHTHHYPPHCKNTKHIGASGGKMAQDVGMV